MVPCNDGVVALEVFVLVMLADAVRVSNAARTILWHRSRFVPKHTSNYLHDAMMNLLLHHSIAE
jgi:hypothetical protein